MRKDLLLVLLFTLPTVLALLRPGFFPMHDDLQPMRQLQMHKCFQDMQIPCRWVPDMGLGYGFPLFNFYPPLPYLVGMKFVLLQFSYIDAIKASFILAVFLSSIGMYFLSRHLWGRMAGIAAAIFYAYAPYKAVDIYVRGALNELWAMTFFPFLFWGIACLVQKPTRKWFILTALSCAGLLLTHNPTTLLLFPAVVVWTIYLVITTKPARFFTVALSAMLGLGIAAFFTLPVLTEQKYVRVDTLISGYFNYLAHFVDLGQLFITPNWGYGGSSYGRGDNMSFFVGYLHWILPLLALILAVLKKTSPRYKITLCLFVVISLYALFMTHSRSSPLWSLVKPLEFLQFPWRYLSLGAFALSVASAAFFPLVRPKLRFVALIVVVGLNLSYFAPQSWDYSLTDTKIFSSPSWEKLTSASTSDYLPVFTPAVPAKPSVGIFRILEGNAEIKTSQKTSDTISVSLKAITPGVIQLQNFYFPGWTVSNNSTNLNLTPSSSGLIELEFAEGSNEVVAKFTNTPVRTIANTLTVISLGIVALVLFLPAKHGQLT